MYLVAYAFLLIALLSALGGAGMGIAQLWQGKHQDLAWLEKANMATTASLGVASCFLLYALATYDFSLEYVASYTDLSLPIFYRLTAFWAGQAGSLLFWALMVALCGCTFLFTRSYKELSSSTRLWYGVFFLAVMAFFGLLLTNWSNPFFQLSPPAGDGRGLNPLLQNPGMIIHPPLLFLGYGGFVVPGCLALAQCMSGRDNNEISWQDAARPFTMTAWLFLTSGIVIGGWWAYMELGWGGYWAWDPVENASLLPWLLATAALHTGLIETRRNKLHRVSAFLMALTTVSAFFATYLVRGNVVNSVHAFGDGGVGTALLIFVIAALVVALFVSLQGKKADAGQLEGLETREGFLVMTAWLLIALTIIILVATLWPVFTSMWSGTSVGLDANFYNKVCLPLFTVLVALLAVCPWLGWRGGVRDWRRFGMVVLVFIVALGGYWSFGVAKAMPLMAAALSTAALVSVVMMLADKSVRYSAQAQASYLVHLGLVLMALGVSFSGPYKTEVEIQLAKGQTVEVGPYTVSLNEMYEGRDQRDTFVFLEAELKLMQDGKDLGIVAPQRRVYHKFGQSAFSEAATYPSLGREFYATLLGTDSEQRAVLRLSSTPLVNWLWIGGLLMTLAPLISLRRRPRIEGDR